MPEVLALARGVQPHRRAELDLVGAHRDLARVAVVDPRDREALASAEPERLPVLARQELERENAHHEQVRAVDALVALRDHRPHAQEVRPFRRPVA